jgi:hypothetical protein
VVTAKDGINDKEIVDDGAGNLSGDGLGRIDYDYGFIEIDFTSPSPVSGTQVEASYDSVEGGCAEDCSRCATHYVELDVTPGTISGSSGFTIVDAWRRLFEKLERDVKPIHVEFWNDVFSEYLRVNIGARFDIIPGDEVPLDTHLLRPILDDSSW